MTTKAGLIALILGSYVIAFGVAGINVAESTGLRWLFGAVIVVGFCVTGWSIVLPWDDEAPDG
jgi:hypothetical protein